MKARGIRPMAVGLTPYQTAPEEWADLMQSVGGKFPGTQIILPPFHFLSMKKVSGHNREKN